MAPSRGKGKTRATASASSGPASRRTRRTPHTTRKAQDVVPEVYGDMLAEAAVADPVLDTGRPLKRRRIVREVSIPSHESQEPPLKQPGKHAAPTAIRPQPAEETSDGDSVASILAVRKQQTVEASSDDSDESDFSFEDVDMAGPAGSDHVENDIADVSISVGPSSTGKSPARAKRKPATIAEKSLRLLVHKAHLLCLLGHCIYVNSWCNNAVVLRNLRSLLDKRMISYLNPKAQETQFQRNRSFIDGLQMATDAFKAHFRLTASGMRKPRWSIDGENDDLKADTEPMDRSDFIRASKDLEGSQDTGNQLLCALLRSAGVDARLVCSLQVLPFASAPKAATPVKVRRPTVFAIASDTDPNISDASADDASIKSSASIGNVPSVRRRLGQPSFTVPPVPAPAPPPKEKKKAIRKLSYPVFWVEAFNPAYQKWTPVDPVVTDTINKPSKFEPPASYEPNQMMYVIAFEDDGVAQDVTRRYAKAFNAKTRRQRVESSPDGAAWLKKAMRVFRRRGARLDRDQIEDTELAQKEVQEGLPGNVLDFKDHPYYALERHLRRHEVLHPKREVGKVNAGTAAKPRMEAVFRRQDVVACRSADKWYRLGREIRPGEHPLRHVPAHSSRRARSPHDDEEEGEREKTSLYAPSQTSLYIPPPVVRGKVPRNPFGNLDIYVSSMVPAGGTHVKHKLAKQAAQILRIDWADAVTGFTFKGRHGTAVIEGVVVAEEYGDAVKDVIEGLEQEVEHDESRLRSLEALRLWKRFLVGLRIAERVSHYSDGSTAEKVRQQMDAEEEKQDDIAEGGGFVLNDAEETAMPTAGRFSLAQLSANSRTSKAGKREIVEEESEAEDENEYIPDAEPVGGRSRRATTRSRRLQDEEEDEADDELVNTSPKGGVDGAKDEIGGGGFVPGNDMAIDGEDGCFILEETIVDNAGGGFLLHDTNGGGGGFMLEDTEPIEAVSFEKDDGGGFVVDEDDVPTINISSAFEPDAGGFLPEKAADEAALQTTISENLPRDVQHAEHELHNLVNVNISLFQPNDEAKQHSDPPHDESAPPRSIKSGLTAVNEQARQATSSRSEVATDSIANEQAVAEPAVDDDDDDDDERGSLLSRDPDDEDAEPDWLESD